MKELDKSIKKIAKGGGIIFIGIIISKILSYIYRIIVARIGVEEYGLFSIGLAVTGFLAMISTLGMGEGVVRYVSYYIGKKQEYKARNIIKYALILTTTFSILVAVSLFILSDWISINLFHNKNLSIILAIFAISLPLDVVKKIILSVMRAFQKIEYEIYSRNLIENISKILLTLLLIYLGFGIIGVAIGYVAAFVISLFVSFYFLQTKVFSLKGKTTMIQNRDILNYSIPLLFTGFMLFIMGWIDTLMIGYFRTTAEVGLYNAALPLAHLLYIFGLYNAALPLAHLLYIFTYALFFLFLPTLSSLYAQKKKEIFKPLYKTLTKWIFWINMILLSFFILFPKQIISTFFGQKYLSTTILFGKEILPVPLSLTILSIGFFFGYLMHGGSTFFLVIKKTKLLLFNSIIIALINLILNYILIPSYGIIGAAIATSTSFLVMGLLLIVEIKIILNIWPFKKSYFRILFSAALSLILTYLLSRIIRFNKDIYSILVLGTFFIICYLVMALITRSFEREDVMILTSIQEKTGLKISFINKILKKFT